MVLRAGISPVLPRFEGAKYRIWDQSCTSPRAANGQRTGRREDAGRTGEVAQRGSKVCRQHRKQNSSPDGGVCQGWSRMGLYIVTRGCPDRIGQVWTVMSTSVHVMSWSGRNWVGPWVCRGWGLMGLYMVPGVSWSGRNRVGPCPAGPELLQEVVEGLAERLFVGHAAVNEVAVADYVYCRY